MDRSTITAFLTRGVSRQDPLLRRAGVGALTVTGAALVATTGVIHLHVWSTGYRAIPAIGTLFLVQGIAALLLALAVVAARRLVVTAIGAGFMAASVGGLLASTTGKLFGFHESFAAPFTGLALVVGVTGLGLLTAAAVVLMTPSRKAEVASSIEPVAPVALRMPVAASPVGAGNGAWGAVLPAGGSSSWKTASRAIEQPAGQRARSAGSPGVRAGGSSSWKTALQQGPGTAVPSWT
jgi:hypothetical protein